MSVITIPAVAHHGYIVPTKRISQKMLDDSIITIHLSPKQGKSIPKDKTSKPKLESFVGKKYKKDLSTPVSMDDFITQLQSW